MKRAAAGQTKQGIGLQSPFGQLMSTIEGMRAFTGWGCSRKEEEVPACREDEISAFSSYGNNYLGMAEQKFVDTLCHQVQLGANVKCIHSSGSAAWDEERQRQFSVWVDPTLDLVLAPRSPLQQYIKTFYGKQKAIANFFGHAAKLNDEKKPSYGGTRAVCVGFWLFGRHECSGRNMEFSWEQRPETLRK